MNSQIYKKVFNEDVSAPEINQVVMNANVRLALAELLELILDYYHKDKDEIDVKVFAIVIFILMAINYNNLNKGDKPRYIDMIAILLKGFYMRKEIYKEPDNEVVGKILKEVENMFEAFFDKNNSSKLILNMFMRDVIFLLTNKETDKFITMFATYLKEIMNLNGKQEES